VVPRYSLVAPAPTSAAGLDGAGVVVAWSDEPPHPPSAKVTTRSETALRKAQA
jgi:hypothetical protein